MLTMLKDFKITRVSNLVAAGTSQIDSSRVDMAGFDSVAFLVGLAIGLLRLLLGLWAVHALRGRALPVDDPALLEAVDLLRAEMSCTRPVEVRESPEISAPATIGWQAGAGLGPRPLGREIDDDLAIRSTTDLKKCRRRVDTRRGCVTIGCEKERRGRIHALKSVVGGARKVRNLQRE